MTVPSTSKRKAVVPPENITPGMSLFDYLRQCNPPLDKKIIDIACSEAKVPPCFREDAAQEIQIMWTSLKPDVETFKPGQIAAYAHSMARHAALRTKRDIGGPVRLPASAFRKRKDGSTYVTPGHLAGALDWNEMESWFQAEDHVDASFGIVALSMESEGVADYVEERQVDPEAGLADQQYKERTALLERNKHVLTRRQFAIMQSLIDGSSYEEIEAELQIKKGVLMREVAIASGIIGNQDL